MGLNVLTFLSKISAKSPVQGHPSSPKLLCNISDKIIIFQTRSTIAHIQPHNHTFPYSFLCLFLITVPHPQKKNLACPARYRNYPHLVCSPQLSVIFLLHESAIILLYYVKHIKHTIFVHRSSVHCGKHWFPLLAA